MTTKELEAKLDAANKRIARLEQAVALILAESHHVQVNEYHSLKNHVEYIAPSLATRGIEEMRGWLTRTQSVQWYGDQGEIEKFVGGDATVHFQGDNLRLIQNGEVFAIPMGGWLTRNPYNGDLHRAAPPKVEDDFELSDVYAEVAR